MEKPCVHTGSETDLVRHALLGEAWAFEEIVFRFQKRVYAIARSQGVSSSAVDDVVQETFLRAFRGLVSLRTPARFGFWLLNIAKTTSVDHLRELRRSRSGAAPPCSKKTEPDSFETKDFGEYLWRKVKELPPGTREAIYLYYHEGECTRKVAEALGISVSAVKSRLQTGRDILRQKLWREMEKCFDKVLPSNREWKRIGRRLALVGIVSVPPAWSSGCRAACGSPARGGGQLSGAQGASSTGSMAPLSGAVLLTAKGILGLLLLLGLAVLAGVWRPTGSPPTNGSPPTKWDGGAQRVKSASQWRPETPRPHEALQGNPRPLQAPAGATGLRGTVFLEDRRTPAEGALVAAILDGAREHSAVAIAGPDGLYEFSRLEPGRYRFWAWRGDWAAKPRSAGLKPRELGPGRTTEEQDWILLPGVIVEGKVTDKHTGKPIGGARVDYAGVQFAFAAQTGRFRLEGIPEGAPRISAQAAAFARRTMELDVVHGERPCLLIELEPGGAIEGVVTGPEGQAAPDAEVRVHVESELMSGITGAQGNYQVDGIPLASSRITISASLGGLYATQMELPGFAGGETRTRLDLRLSVGHTVAGRVLDSLGDPLPQVQLCLQGTAASRRTYMTDDAGHFAIDGVTEKVHTLLARKEGFAPASFGLRGCPPDERTAIEMVLRPGHAVSGFVVDPEGTPIEGAFVYVTPGEDAKGSNLWAETDRAGRFRMTDLPGNLTEIGALKEGFAGSRYNPVEADQEDLEIVLEPGGHISGVVIDAGTGLPVHPFRVKANLTEALSPVASPISRGGFPFEKEGRFEVRPSAFCATEGFQYGFTDGRFALRSGLVCGRLYDVTVVSEGYQELLLRRVQARRPSEYREPIVLRLAKGEAVRGQLVAEATGEGLAGVRVTHLTGGGDETFWLRDRREADSTARETFTDAEGRFEIHGLPEGSGVLLLEQPGFARTAIRGVRPGQGFQMFHLDKAAAIEGRVWKDQGDPLPRARVCVSVKGELFPEAVTDAEGSYLIRDLPSGAAEVGISCPSALRTFGLATLLSGKTAILDYEIPSGSIEARVTDRGSPVPGARVLVEGATDRRPSARGFTDATGVLRIGGVPPGTYEVMAWSPEAQGFLSRATRLVEVGRTDALCEIPLAQTSRIRGYLSDPLRPSGGPPAMVAIFRRSPEIREKATWTGAGLDWILSGSAPVDSGRNEFSLNVPAPGSYFLAAYRSGEARPAAWLGPIEINDSEPLDPLALLADGSASIRVLVLGGTAEMPVKDARVLLRPGRDDPVEFRARVDDSGAAVFSDIPAGRYRLEVSSSNHLPFAEEVDVGTAGQGGHLVHLEPASWIVLAIEGIHPSVKNLTATAMATSGGDPGWRCRSVPENYPVESRSWSPEKPIEPPPRFKVRPGNYGILFKLEEPGRGTASGTILEQEVDVRVPEAGEATVHLVVAGH